MLTPIPPNVLGFSVPGGFEDEAQWAKWEPVVIDVLQVPEATLIEIRRLFVANCFQAGGRFMCNFEAFYSTAWILFTLSRTARTEDWPMVSQCTQQSPKIIFKALGLEATQYWSHGEFFLFTLNGVSAQFSLDLATVGQAAAHFTRILGDVKPEQDFALKVAE